MPFLSGVVEDFIPSNLRLDRYIAEYLRILSRSQIKARELKANLNGKAVKNSRILKRGDHFELSWLEAECSLLLPQDLPLDVIYENERVIVVNKAQGMVVHPGAGNRHGTLANALLFRRIQKVKGHFINDNLTGENPAGSYVTPLTETYLRPGIVHRLDKDTSGVMIAAWDDEALAFLSDQFKARRARKTYAAIVPGCPKEKSGCITKNINRSVRDRKIFTVSDSDGRASTTYYRLVRTYGNYSLLLLRPKTGRTHQLRVHLKYLGTPILGDPIYGREDKLFPKVSLMLHAKSLSLILPGFDAPQKFRTALPDRFKEIIRVLNKRN